MINLEKINTGSDLYTWSEKLWLDSFPEIERRDTALQRLNTDTCPIFNYNVAISENRPVGLLHIGILKSLFIANILQQTNHYEAKVTVPKY